MRNLLFVSHDWTPGFELLRALTDSGFRAYSAGSAFQAIHQLASRPFTAVVVSPMLPDIAVADVIAFVKQHNPDAPVIMMPNQMPLSEKAPEGVDSVVARHHAAELLVPTVEALLTEAVELASAEDPFAQAA